MEDLGEWLGPVLPSWEIVNPCRRSPAASELSTDGVGPLSYPARGPCSDRHEEEALSLSSGT